MHTGQGGGLSSRESLDHRGRVLRMRVVVQLLPERLAGFEDVGVRNWSMFSARLAEQISAQEGTRSLFGQEPAFPCVGEVRGIEPPDPVSAERDDFSVFYGARFAVGDIGN